MERGALSIEEIEQELTRLNVEILGIEDGYVVLELIEILKNTDNHFTLGQMARLGMAFEMIGKMLLQKSTECIKDFGLYHDDDVTFFRVEGRFAFLPKHQEIRKHYPRSDYPNLYNKVFKPSFVEIEPPD